MCLSDRADNSEKALELGGQYCGEIEKSYLERFITKRGAYSLGLTAVAVAVVIVINLVAGRLPESVRNIDISDNQSMEITDTSQKESCKKLDEKSRNKVIGGEIFDR